VDPASVDVNRDLAWGGLDVVPVRTTGMNADAPAAAGKGGGGGDGFDEAIWSLTAPGELDVLILPEGYTKAQSEKMYRDAARFAGILLGGEPWAGRADRISVRLVRAFSRESGPDEPRKGIFRDTALDAAFNTFGAERYLTTAHNKAMRELASVAPYDVIVVMVNTARYGGGGVYNQWTIFPSDNEYDDYVLLHELGHSFAGLADEYFDSAVSYDADEFYPPGVEPVEPNITAFLAGRRETVKWADMIAEGVPVPTPPEEKWKGAVGLFEGAGYKPKGLYRPALDCKMFHKGLVPFCPVCARSIEKMIDFFTGGEK